MLDATRYGVTKFGAEACPGLYWDCAKPFNPGAPVAGASLKVFANEGRWIVSCPAPNCGGAQLASQTDPRFMCIHCGNAANGGNWYPIAWPDRGAIEAALTPRPAVNQNWLPGITVATLLAENTQKGLH